MAHARALPPFLLGGLLAAGLLLVLGAPATDGPDRPAAPTPPSTSEAPAIDPAPLAPPVPAVLLAGSRTAADRIYRLEHEKRALAHELAVLRARLARDAERGHGLEGARDDGARAEGTPDEARRRQGPDGAVRDRRVPAAAPFVPAGRMLPSLRGALGR